MKLKFGESVIYIKLPGLKASKL